MKFFLVEFDLLPLVSAFSAVSPLLPGKLAPCRYLGPALGLLCVLLYCVLCCCAFLLAPSGLMPWHHKAVLCSLAARMCAVSCAICFCRLYLKGGHTKKRQNLDFVCVCARAGVCVLQRAGTRQSCRESPLRGQSYAWEYNARKPQNPCTNFMACTPPQATGK